jgi:hypothetical protein
MLWLAAGEDSICAELQASGEFCEIVEGESTTHYSYGQQNTYFGICPCAAELICSSAVNSNQESDVSSIFYNFGMCKAAELETEEEESAE